MLSLYMPLSELIERRKKEIAQEVATTAHTRKLPSYLKYSVAELAIRFLPTVEMLARYVTSADPHEYRDYISTLAEQRLSQGFDMNDFFVMGELLSNAAKNKVQEEFSQPQQVQRYFRRLDGVQTLAQATVAVVQARIHNYK